MTTTTISWPHLLRTTNPHACMICGHLYDNTRWFLTVATYLGRDRIACTGTDHNGRALACAQTARRLAV